MATDGDFDYRQLSRSQLLEALNNIDASRFPINHRRLVAEIELRKPDDASERPLEVSKRVLNLRRREGDIQPSFITRSFYIVGGAFYFFLPLCIYWCDSRFAFTSDKRSSAFFIITVFWVMSAFFLFGLVVTYSIEAGIIKCLLLGRYILWKDKVSALEDVRGNYATIGLPTVLLAWADHKRRLWLTEWDLDTKDEIA